MKRILLVFAVILVAVGVKWLVAVTTLPTILWFVNTQIKNVGTPTCIDGKEHQAMALEATFTNGTKSIIAEWSQLTGKECQETTRGKVPDRPNPEGAQAAMKGEAPGEKPRGCGHYYLWWDYGTYYYVEYYDEHWRYCYWRKYPK